MAGRAEVRARARCHDAEAMSRKSRTFKSPSPCPLMGHTVNMTHILPCVCIPRPATCAPQFALHSARRAYSHFPPARRRRLLQECRASPARKGKRSFTAATRQRYADSDSSPKYRQQDRESDEVDVCIVGGGKSCLDTDLLP